MHNAKELLQAPLGEQASTETSPCQHELLDKEPCDDILPQCTTLGAPPNAVQWGNLPHLEVLGHIPSLARVCAGGGAARGTALPGTLGRLLVRLKLLFALRQLLGQLGRPLRQPRIAVAGPCLGKVRLDDLLLAVTPTLVKFVSF